jgi:hypothetical protein
VPDTIWRRLVGVLPVEFLGCRQVPPRSFSFSLCRALVRTDVSEALPNRKFLDVGGTFMSGAGFIVAIQFAVARLLVPLMSELGVLGGTLQIFARDGLASGKFFVTPAPRRAERVDVGRGRRVG